MPTYTVAEQRALVLRRLRVADTTRFSPTGGSADYAWIDDALERGEEEFVRRTKCLRTYAIIQLKENKRVYRLPDDYLDMMAAYYYHTSLTEGYKELTIKSIEELNDDVSDWRTDTGEPSFIYHDRQAGPHLFFGLNPIPDADGAAITFADANVSELTWICTLYSGRQDFGRVLRWTGDDTFVLSSNDQQPVDAEVSNGNILIEYYRSQYNRTELPPDAGKAISLYAASDLLSDNPEDSAEYKRSQTLLAQFEREIGIYSDKRKRPQSGKELRARPMVWNWQQNMTYYKEMR
jgi:hypothetical protein